KREGGATGPRDARRVLLHDGTPAGLLAAPSFVARAAAERGLRLVQYNRPGYGGSTPDPGRPVADAAGDVAAVLDAPGVAEVPTVGWSRGGPPAPARAPGPPRPGPAAPRPARAAAAPAPRPRRP